MRWDVMIDRLLGPLADTEKFVLKQHRNDLPRKYLCMHSRDVRDNGGCNMTNKSGGQAPTNATTKWLLKIGNEVIIIHIHGHAI